MEDNPDNRYKAQIAAFHLVCSSYRISVGANLKKKRMEVDGICKHCGEVMETVEHLVFHCAKVKLIWKLAPVQWDDIQQHTFSFE